MRKFGGLSSIVFLIGLLVPGYALATGYYTFQGPPTTVFVGQTFDVRVYLTVVDGPTKVCAADYCANYNQLQNLIQMVPLNIQSPSSGACANTTPPVQAACFGFPPNVCITQPPIDGGLFQLQNDPPFPPRTCDDNCTQPDFPLASNCAPGTDPPCDPPEIPRVSFFVQAGETLISDTPLVFDYPCGIDVPFGPTLVSTLTFKALSPGCFQFTKGPCANIVVDCDTGEPDNMTIVNDPNQICIVERPAVPAFSVYGIVIFAFMIAGSFILILRRYRRAERSES